MAEDLERLATLALGLLKIGAIEQLGGLGEGDPNRDALVNSRTLAAYWRKNLSLEHPVICTSLQHARELSDA